ncbi:MAG TPA: PEGA domain-containing protein [Chitinispirillaceae bacterium]|nr:PEGA domain-containing protein [Chitinispirillaceae bacterium]
MSKIFICTILLLFSLSFSYESESSGSKKSNDSLNNTASDRLNNGHGIDSVTKNPDSQSIDTDLNKSADVTIITEPSEAAVVFNDSVTGLSPVIVKDVPVGKHNLILKKKGYYMRKIGLQVDSSVTFKFVLNRPGSIFFTSEPSGAQIYIDERSAGKTPFVDSIVKPGEYSVRVEASGFKPFERKITVSSGGSDTLKFVLEPSVAVPDTIESVQDTEERNGKKIKTVVVASAFALFGLVLLFIESFGSND